MSFSTRSPIIPISFSRSLVLYLQCGISVKWTWPSPWTCLWGLLWSKSQLWAPAPGDSALETTVGLLVLRPRETQAATVLWAPLAHRLLGDPRGWIAAAQRLSQRERPDRKPSNPSWLPPTPGVGQFTFSSARKSWGWRKHHAWFPANERRKLGKVNSY